MKHQTLTMKTAAKTLAILSAFVALVAPADVLVYRTTEVSKATGYNKVRTVVGQGYTVYDITDSKAMIILGFNAGGKTYRTNEINNIMVAGSVGPVRNTTTTFAASTVDPNYNVYFFFLTGKEFTLNISTNASVRAPQNMTGIVRSIEFQNETNTVVTESSLNLHFAPTITGTNNNAQHTYSEVIDSLIAGLKANGFSGSK